MRIPCTPISRTLIVCAAAVVALAACSGLPQQNRPAPPSTPEGTVEQALQLKDDGKAGDAAGVMLQVSERAGAGERPQLVFEAAQLYLSVPDAAHANEVLQKLRGFAPDSAYTKILSAQLALQDGNAAAAIAQLKPAPPAGITPTAKGAYWLTLAQAYAGCVDAAGADKSGEKSAVKSAEKRAPGKKQTATGKNCLFNALQAHVEADDVLLSPPYLAKNQDALWQLMAAQPAADLNACKSKSKNGALKGWLELALLAKKSKSSVPEQEIRAWRAKYPNQVVLNQRLLALRGLPLDKIRHVALILPTKSTELGPFAKAVWEGFQAAQKSDANAYPVKLYETDANPAATLNAYRSALEKGALLVVGPLSRSSLALLAQRRLLAVPTVALNVVDDGKYPINLYQFGLPIAQEARVIARGAKDKGFTEALVLKGNGALDARSSEAFIKEWSQFQYTVKATLPVQDVTAIGQLAAAGLTPNTMVFVAADFKSALPAIKAMPVHWTVFGTSVLNTASPEVALLNKSQKIYFVDVPSLVEAPTAADRVAPPARMDAVSARLYALGVDVRRFSALLLRDEVKFNRPLINGETGKLSVARNGNVERDLSLVLLQGASLASYYADDLAKLATNGKK